MAIFQEVFASDLLMLSMEDKPQLPIKKQWPPHTQDENKALYNRLEKETSTPSFSNGTTAWLQRLEERLTQLELYCYERLEVNFTIRWDPSQCSPRVTQRDLEILIWRTKTRM